MFPKLRMVNLYEFSIRKIYETDSFGDDDAVRIGLSTDSWDEQILAAQISIRNFGVNRYFASNYTFSLSDDRFFSDGRDIYFKRGSEFSVGDGDIAVEVTATPRNSEVSMGIQK